MKQNLIACLWVIKDVQGGWMAEFELLGNDSLAQGMYNVRGGCTMCDDM